MDDIFVWEDSFLTNNSIIDNQHKKLIDTINEAIKSTIDNTKYSKKAFHKLKDDIFRYINTHFITEEKIMADSNIYEKHSIEHLKTHHDFISWFKTNFEEDITSISQVNIALEYLIRWLAYHILNTDKILFKQIESIENGLSPIDAYNLYADNNHDSFDPLLKALKSLYYVVLEKNKMLERANIELEYNVRQRTNELEEANKRLEAISLTDMLTGLPNRRYLDMILNQYFENWKRYKTNTVVMFIDVDKFKQVNDTQGHDVGDKLLKWISEYLKVSFRKSDIICRLGGDEFVVICPYINIEDGVNAANKIISNLKTISGSFFSTFWHPSISIGLCCINESTQTIDEIIKKADKAMYVSKEKGGNLTTAST